MIGGLHVRLVGAGPPLLLLHGLGGSVITWSRVETALAARSRLVMVDLRGFGRSVKPLDAPYGLHDHARDMLAVIEGLDLRDLVIVGNSLGGGIALLTALSLLDEGSKRLRGLILIDSIALPQWLPLFVRGLMTPLIGPAALRLLPPRLGVRMVLGQIYRRRNRIDPAFVAAYAQPLGTPEGRHGLIATTRGMIPPDIDTLVRRFAGLDRPALLIWGRQDRLVRLRMGERLARVMPDAALTIIEDCGHAPQEEQPEETTAAITAFLDFLRRPSSGEGPHRTAEIG